jgi:putative polyhydroxyalkanoate system protein
MLPQLSQSVIPGYTEHMSEILVTRSHKLSMKKARLAAEHVAVDLEKEFDLTYAWDEDGVLRFERTGIHGQLTLAKHEVTVQVKLAFFYLPFRAALEREIHEYFDQRFS